jgi:hypothetical protein
MNVVVWLRGRGLRKYEAAFRENEVDATLIPRLTHENLKELGVTAEAPKRCLLTGRPRSPPRANFPETAPSAAKW